MNTLILLAIVMALAVAAFLLVRRGFRSGGLVPLANVAPGFWRGKKTYLVDEVVASRYLLAKPGSDDLHVGICDAADIPIGVMTDEAATIEDALDVALFGSADETRLGVPAADIDFGEFLVPADGGEVQPLPTAAGVYYIVGRSLKTVTAVSGDLVEYDPCMPTQRVVEET